MADGSDFTMVVRNGDRYAALYDGDNLVDSGDDDEVMERLLERLGVVIEIGDPLVRTEVGGRVALRPAVSLSALGI